MGLVDEEIVGQDEEADAGQVELVQAGGFVGAVADEASAAASQLQGRERRAKTDSSQ